MSLDASNATTRHRLRFLLLLAWIAVAFLALVFRLYQVQIRQGAEYLALSHDNYISTRREVALRGLIFDRQGRLLVDNRPTFNLYFTPAFCRRDAFEGILQRLDEMLGLTGTEREQIQKAFRTARKLDRYLPVPVRYDLYWKDVVSLTERRDSLDGFDVWPETRRSYPEGALAAHLLGYVAEINPRELAERAGEGYLQGDLIGRTGVERMFETELRGLNGQRRRVVDARGQPVPAWEEKLVLSDAAPVEPARPGANLVLTLDARLQEVAEARFPGRAGAVVAIDPRNGYILAMVSRPTFDPNLVSGRVDAKLWQDLSRNPDRPLINRAIQEHYPPGSTFKPFVALAALEYGGLTADTRQHCTGALPFGDHVFRCWRAGGHGNIAVREALTRSCDVFFYRAGLKATLDRIATVAHSCGLGRPVLFDPAFEVAGLVPDVAWYRANTQTGFLPGFTLSDSIGQGDVTVTPLQQALAYASIANGGTLYRPQIALRLEAPDGAVIREFPPEVLGRVEASAENIRIVREGLTGVANDPSGTAFWTRPRNVNFQVVGKTGTSQVVRQGADRGRELPFHLRDHAWFVAWAPAENPRIAVAVINEHAGHGSTGAAPLAMELITFYLERIEPLSASGEGR